MARKEQGVFFWEQNPKEGTLFFQTDKVLTKSEGYVIMQIHSALEERKIQEQEDSLWIINRWPGRFWPV